MTQQISHAHENSFETRLARCWTAAGQGQGESALEDAGAILLEAALVDRPDVVARANHHIAWFLGVLGRASEALEPIIGSRAIWLQLGNEAEISRCKATYAWILMELGDMDSAMPESSEALRLAETAGDDDVLALASNTHALCLVLAGQLDAAAPLLDQAVSLGRAGKDTHALSRWLINRGYLFACSGDHAREFGDEAGRQAAYLAATRVNAEGYEIAERSGSAWYQRIALANAAEYRGVMGEPDEALALLERWEAIEGDAGDRLTIQFLYTKSEILTRSGRADEARAVCELAVERSKATGITLHELNSVRRLSEVHEAMKDHLEALAHFKQYHLLYKKFAGEAAQRRARITQVFLETDKYKTLAIQANRRADLMAADALLDPLTGISNRRALDNMLARVDQERSTFALAVIDLDHFKRVNDRFSHLVGDDVLRHVARTIVLAVRSTDFVARMGGEEFVLVLPGATTDMAEKICYALRAKLAALNWHEITPGLKTTASIGIADSGEERTSRKVLQLADHRLYKAKAQGRDRIVGPICLRPLIDALQSLG